MLSSWPATPTRASRRPLGAVGFGDTPVLYVIGSHEYFGHALPKLTGQRSAAGADSAVRVLECAAMEMGGIRFVGCTLWTDLACRGNPYLAGIALTQAMTDFRAIRVAPAYRRSSPADVAAQHRASVAWLKSAWGRSDLPTVVVSHHAPSALRSIRAAPTTPWMPAMRPPRAAHREQPVAWIHHYRLKDRCDNPNQTDWAESLGGATGMRQVYSPAGGWTRCRPGAGPVVGRIDTATVACRDRGFWRSDAFAPRTRPEGGQYGIAARHDAGLRA